MNDTELIKGAIAQLPTLGLRAVGPVQWEPRGRQEVDAIVTIARGTTKQKFVVEAKRGVAPGTLGAALAHLNHAKRVTKLPGLLVTTRMTPQTGDRLREMNVPFLDTAGNCYLATKDFLVFVTGRKTPAETLTGTGAKVFTPAGLKVLFALICDAELANAPQRAIADAAGVALGTVPTTLADLRNTGRLLETKNARRLNANKRLLDEWALGYAQQLRPKTLHAAYETPDFPEWRKWNLDVEQVRWGGEPAANLVAGYLQPGVLTLYGQQIPPKMVIEHRLKQAGPREIKHRLELRKPFWGRMLRYDGRADTVALPLIYADLLATADARCLEMAQRLYDERLARPFPAG